MKIVHVAHSLHPDGPADMLLDLAPVAASAGLEPVVVTVCASAHQAPARELRRRGVPVVELNCAPWDPRAVPRALLALREHRPAVVHTHLRHGDVVGALAAHRAGLPVVSSLHRIENLPAGTADRLRRTVKILARRRFAARTVAISELQRDRYRRVAGTARGLVVVPNGLADPGPVDPAARARTRAALGVPAGGVLAVSAAPMRRGKGQDLLLDALAAVPAAVPLTVVLAGDGPLRPWLESRVQVSDVLRGRVRFDPLADPVARTAAADLVLHTTRADAVPRPLVLAAALGVPAVATHVGGIPEVVTARTGVLVALDADRIAAELTRLAGDPERRAALGSAARERYLDRFEGTGWAARLRAVYDDVLRAP